MNIIYVISRYPNLTETFIAREIEQVIKAGNRVSICILKPTILKPSIKRAIRVKDAIEIRFTYNVFSLILSVFSVLFNKPWAFFKVFIESLGSSILKPTRAHHIFYLLITAIWFSTRKELQNNHYIHSHFLHAGSIAARWLSILLGKPYGITSHVMIIRFDQKIISKVISHSSICIGDNKQVTSQLEKLSSEKVYLIRNGIDVSKIDYIPPSILKENNNNTPLILATGSLQYTKGFHVLIKACALLKEKGVFFQSRIIGEGIERHNLEYLIQELKIGDQIAMLGALSIDELFEQYKQATVFVMPSVSSPFATDGLPTVIIEAMSIGLPVIGTAHAAIPEIIANGKTGLIVNPGEHDSLANAIIEIINNKNLYYKISRNGREIVERDFDLVKNSKKFIQLINDNIVK